jgi:hypothetical protein
MRISHILLSLVRMFRTESCRLFLEQNNNFFLLIHCMLLGVTMVTI